MRAWTGMWVFGVFFFTFISMFLILLARPLYLSFFLHKLSVVFLNARRKQRNLYRILTFIHSIASMTPIKCLLYQ
jgi:hypothetical protein